MVEEFPYFEEFFVYFVGSWVQMKVDSVALSFLFLLAYMRAWLHFECLWKVVILQIIIKGKDLSESGKQKSWTHFLLKTKILNRKWRSHLPMKEKTLGSHWSRANLRGTFSNSRFHWQMGQPFVFQNLNFK